MAISLSGRSFLKLLDFKKEEIRYLLDLSKEFKRLKMTSVNHKCLEGKNVVLVFEKTSTRTRCAFEVAAMDLGMGVTYLDPTGSQMGKKESIRDTASVLGRMYDGIEYRGYKQSVVEEIAVSSGVPVWNGLTDEFHPTQMLADLLTIEEKFGRLEGINFTFMGDARNNVANSLMVACSKMGVNFTCVSPNSLFPNDELVGVCQEFARDNGSSITLTEDVSLGCTNADVIYTDIWVSMGEPDEIWQQRIQLLHPYQVSKKVMDMAKNTAIFLHCLPSFHDLNTAVGTDIYKKFGIPEMEVANEVFESKQSHVFDQAENRMHTIKAVMYATLK